MDDLHIQKTGVVHQDQAGLVLGQQLHPFRFIGKAGTGHAEPGQALDQVSPEEIAFSRHPVFRAGKSQSFFIRDMLNADFQNSARPSLLYIVTLRILIDIIPKKPNSVKDWSQFPLLPALDTFL